MTTQIKQRFGGRFMAGIALMITGALLMLQQIGFLHSVDLSRSWPIILIVLAIAQLAATMRDARQRGWGLLLIGDWMFVNTMTDWAFAQLTWPILLTGIGGFMIVRSFRHRERAAVRESQLAV